MSLVLGPVHHWMYKKIKTTEAREASVVDALKDRYGQEADEILNCSVVGYDPDYDIQKYWYRFQKDALLLQD